MQIRLENIDYSLAMSRGSFAFTADLLIDGQVVGKVFNHGDGGEHVFQIKPGYERTMEAATRYLDGLPQIDYVRLRGKVTMERLVSQLVAVKSARDQLREQTEQLCGPQAQVILLMNRNTGELILHELPMGTRVRYSGRMMSAQEAAVETHREDGKEVMILNEVYAQDPQEAFDYMVMASDVEVRRLVNWTLEDAAKECGQPC